MITFPVLTVARAVGPGAAENAHNTTQVVVKKLKAYFRNETYAAEANAAPAEEPMSHESDRSETPGTELEFLWR